SPITPVFAYIYLCPLEFCSCQLGITLRVGQSNYPHIHIHISCFRRIGYSVLTSIASVGHSDHVHVLIHGYVFAGILLSSIEYSVAGRPARSLPYLHTYTYVRWSSALVKWVLRCESASPTTL